MGHLSHRVRALILACAFVTAGTVFLAQSPPRKPQGSPGRTGPVRTPESGLLPGGGPTTRPGSHETSTKDERDRVAGKFPAPKEKDRGSEAGDERSGGAPATAFVDVVALEAQRPAVTLTAEDLRVSIDGVLRPIVSMHYVFRGPQALVAGRSIPVGRGVVARGDEERTIVVVVDEPGMAPAESKDAIAGVEHVLDVAAPTDRAAVISLSAGAAVKFADTRAELLDTVARLNARPASSRASANVLQSLALVLNGLAGLGGPKQIIFFSARREPETRPATVTTRSPEMLALTHAAAASRSTVHVVLSPDAVATADLREIARSTGGILVRLTGEVRELEPLATVMLGGYLVGMSSLATDRDGRPHTLAVTTTRRGVRLHVAAQWMPRNDPLPQLIPQPVRTGASR